jgi:morphogenetic protein associated with SpoVID
MPTQQLPNSSLSPSSLAPAYYGPDAYSSSNMTATQPMSYQEMSMSSVDPWGGYYPPNPVSPYAGGGYPTLPQTGGEMMSGSPYHTGGGYGYSPMSMPMLHSNAPAGFPGFDTQVNSAGNWGNPSSNQALASTQQHPYGYYQQAPESTKKPCNCGCGDKRTEENESAKGKTKTSSVVKRKIKPEKKVVIQNAAQPSRLRRTNQPWINR